MKKIIITAMLFFFLAGKLTASSILHNDYSYLQEITFELYNDQVPAYKVPEQLKSIEETLMFEILHATWKDKHWVAYTLNKDLLGTFKVGQPALLDNGASKKMFFIAAFPGSVGGLDIYTSEYSNGKWSKPKNLGKSINTPNNESNPGLLNDHTLTYSSDGIIKKLDLNTLKVVDLEESFAKDTKTTGDTQNTTQNKIAETKNENKEVVAAIGDNSTATPTGNATDSDYGAIGDNSTAMPAKIGEGSGAVQNQTRISTDEVVVKEKVKEDVSKKMEQNKPQVNTVAPAPQNVQQSANVQYLGAQSRDAMLAKYKTAIQLGAFSAPKWELIEPLSKFGKIVTYKNDSGANVVWIVGFANRAAAENVLPHIKTIAGFENAYVTGK
ncbi:MAG TPA: hypothetical protein PLS10_04975 [Chitinophagales bacterium]|nr:hypothetical protein [Chitinophagales bacterium]